MDESVEFSENLGAFVRTQRRIVDDFGRSLSNARHFLNLAHRSLEREPEETVTMLQQIREIDLLGHLSHQFDEYRGVAGLLLSPPVPSADPDLVGEVAELQQSYEALLEEAEKQTEAIDRLLFSLQVQH